MPAFLFVSFTSTLAFIYFPLAFPECRNHFAKALSLAFPECRSFLRRHQPIFTISDLPDPCHCSSYCQVWQIKPYRRHVHRTKRPSNIYCPQCPESKSHHSAVLFTNHEPGGHGGLSSRSQEDKSCKRNSPRSHVSKHSV